MERTNQSANPSRTFSRCNRTSCIAVLNALAGAGAGERSGQAANPLTGCLDIACCEAIADIRLLRVTDQAAHMDMRIHVSVCGSNVACCIAVFYIMGRVAAVAANQASHEGGTLCRYFCIRIGDSGSQCCANQTAYIAGTNNAALRRRGTYATIVNYRIVCIASQSAYIDAPIDLLHLNGQIFDDRILKISEQPNIHLIRFIDFQPANGLSVAIDDPAEFPVVVANGCPSFCIIGQIDIIGNLKVLRAVGVGQLTHGVELFRRCDQVWIFFRTRTLRHSSRDQLHFHLSILRRIVHRSRTNSEDIIRFALRNGEKSIRINGADIGAAHRPCDILRYIFAFHCGRKEFCRTLLYLRIRMRNRHACDDGRLFDFLNVFANTDPAQNRIAAVDLGIKAPLRPGGLGFGVGIEFQSKCDALELCFRLARRGVFQIAGHRTTASNAIAAVIICVL